MSDASLYNPIFRSIHSATRPISACCGHSRQIGTSLSCTLAVKRATSTIALGIEALSRALSELIPAHESPTVQHAMA